MDSDVIKKQIAAMVKKVGPKQAQVTLVTAGLGLSTVQKILKGDYDPGPKAAKILESVIANIKAS